MDLVQIRIRLEGGKKAAAEAEATAAAIKETELATTSANKKTVASSKKVGSSLAKQSAAMKSVGMGVTKYFTLPLVGAAAISGKLALDFDRSMRNVNSIAGLPEAQFKRLKQSVLDLAGPTAQAPNTLAEGLYDLVSSGFKANESIGILRASAIAASAGLTTTEVSTKAVAAVLNAYNLKASDAKAVSDTLFETVNRGVLTFDDLASTVGDVLPFAAQLGVNLNEVGAATSTMTKGGLSSAETMTRIKNVLVTLLKPGKELKDRLKEMGTTGEGLAKKKGLQGALEAIIAPAHGSKEAIAAMFPNIRALGGVLSLTGINAKRAGEDLAGFKDTTGATAKVLHEQEKSFGFKLQRAWAQLQVTLIELGEKILPIVVPFLQGLAESVKSGVEWFEKLPDPLKKTMLELTAMVAIAGPMLIFAGSITSAAKALGLLGETGMLSKLGMAKGLAGAGGLAAVLGGQAVGGTAGNLISGVGGGAGLGFMLGGPMGAAIGGGLGGLAAVAPEIIGLFKSSPKLSKTFREVQAQTKSAKQAMLGYRSALRGLPAASKRVQSAQEHLRTAQRNAKAAASNQARVLGEFPAKSGPAWRAALKLARANHAVARSSRAVQAANRLQGFALKLFRQETIHAVASQKQRIPALRHEKAAIEERMKREGETTTLLRRVVAVQGKLSGVNRTLTKTYAEAEAKGSKPFARSLKDMNSQQAQFGAKGKVLVTRLREQREALANIPPQIKGAVVPAFKELREEIAATASALERFSAVNEGLNPSRNIGGGGPGKLGAPAPRTPTPRKGSAKTPPKGAGRKNIGLLRSGGDTTIKVPVYLDGKQIAESSAKAVADAQARLGL